MNDPKQNPPDNIVGPDVAEEFDDAAVMIEDALIAVANDRAQAQAALAAVHAAGIPTVDIGFVAPVGTTDSGVFVGDNVPGGQLLAIPGSGPFLVAGILLPPLRAAAVDDVVGGLIGALVSLGFPRALARDFEGRIAAGGVLIAVRAGGPAAIQQLRDLVAGVGIDAVASLGEAATDKAHPLPATVDPGLH